MKARVAMKAAWLAVGMAAALFAAGCGGGGERDPNRKTPEGYSQIYRCQECKHEPAFTVEQINEFYLSKKVGSDSIGEPLYPCPKCGKVSVKAITIGPDGNEVK